MRLRALEEECERLRGLLGENDPDEEVRGKLPPFKSRRPDLTILDKAADGIFTLDGKGVLTYINAAGKRMLGGGEVIQYGVRFLDLLGTMANRHLLMEIVQWLRNPKEPSSYLLVDVPVVNRSGDERWLSVHLQKHLSQEGQIQEIQGMARDITEQHRLQLSLRRSEEHYRGIIENMLLGILEVDNEERITRAFPRFCAIVGYSEEELLGKKASDVLMREEDRQLMDERTRQRNAGESGLYEVPIRNKKGEEIWLLISGVPLLDNSGEVVGSMGIHYDITERKRDEKQLIAAKNEADAARLAERAFLARMSHEVRTPMNAILGMARLLERSDLSGDQQGFVQALVQGGEVLKGILDNVLDLARLEDGHATLNTSSVEIKPLFESVVDTYEVLLSEKGVRIALDWSSELPRALKLDPGTLTQILMNLLGNAAKFTEQGEVNLAASLKAETDRKQWLHVEVRDTGAGIPEEAQGVIFERFGQVEPAEGKLREGSGLGLAIVKELCHLHGGDISVESAVGVGSTFRFRIAVESAEVQSQTQRSADISHWSERHILVAEDNQVNVFYLSKLLQGWGLRYTLAANGLEAVEAFNAEKVDLILMDIQMPICDGLEATRRIRKMASGNDVPIVGLSAFTSAADRDAGKEAGMNQYLAKPYSPEALRDVLLMHI